MLFRVELSGLAQEQLPGLPKDGPYRIVFRKFPAQGIVEVSAILVRSKDTYR
jgi:hypothetical protein